MSLRATDKERGNPVVNKDCFATSNVVVAFDAIVPSRNDKEFCYTKLMRNYLRHFFIPHDSNGHRAKLLHLDSILLIIALLIFSFSLLATVESKYPSVLGISYNISITDLLDITNKVRGEHGVSTLSLNPDLSKAAANKASDMFGKNYWAHIAPDGITPWVFIKNSGYDYLYAGENLGRGFSDSQDLVNAWMASPSHRDNMLSDKYKDVGFAITTGNLTGSDTVLVVEMFGTRYQDTSSTAEGPIPQAVAMNVPTPLPSIFVSEASKMPLKSNVMKQTEVAAIVQQPLVDRKDFTKNIIFSIIVLFIAVLLIDAIVIERKKIIRVVSHNIDHIVYLVIIFAIIIVIGRGLVL